MRAMLIATLLTALFISPTARGATGPRVDHADLDAILQECVRDGLVDYLTIRSKHWDRLTGYLNRMGDVDHQALPRDERLALYCNLYNATMIRTVVERFHARYSPAENNKQIFRDSLVRVRGRTITLNELEHVLIRDGFKEPLIHAALVCAGLGCPKHPAHAYAGDGLQKAFEADFKAWVNEPTRNQIDPAAGTAHLSKLFKSYADDFGGVDATIAYVDRYTDADLSKMKVTFSTKYDWTLNIAPPPAGTAYVYVASGEAQLFDAPDGNPLRPAAENVVFEVVERADGWIKVDRAFGQGTAWVAAAQVSPFVVKAATPDNL